MRNSFLARRLHAWLVGTFSLVAMVPTILVAVFAAFTLNFGIDNWFSSHVKAALRGASVASTSTSSPGLTSWVSGLVGGRSASRESRAESKARSGGVACSASDWPISDRQADAAAEREDRQRRAQGRSPGQGLLARQAVADLAGVRVAVRPARTDGEVHQQSVGHCLR